MRDRPETSEYDAFYTRYIDKVPDGDILEILAGGVAATLRLLGRCPQERERFAYAPGKWSIREVVGHVADAERLYAYRALHFARGDSSPLPGMDPRAWAARSNVADRALSSLAAELESVRAATVSLFSSLPETTWTVTGSASGRVFSVRALAYVIAGHEIHHREVLAERYLDDGAS